MTAVTWHLATTKAKPSAPAAKAGRKPLHSGAILRSAGGGDLVTALLLHVGKFSSNDALERVEFLRSNPWNSVREYVRFGSEADMCAAKSDVRFAPDSDRESGFSKRSCPLHPESRHVQRKHQCPLRAKSRHSGKDRTNRKTASQRSRQNPIGHCLFAHREDPR
jgi:hypothetical protein